MPRIGVRARWLGTTGVVLLLIGFGLGLAWSRRSSDPVRQGLAAYARGDWAEAADLARLRLSPAGDDPSCAAPPGADFGSAGSSTDGAETLRPTWQACLAGRGSLPPGSRPVENRKYDRRRGGLGGSAVGGRPDHTETLLELMRAYIAADQFLAARQAGRVLETVPGWEARTQVLLGAIELELNNPDGAITFWTQATERPWQSRGAGRRRPSRCKDLARAYMKVGRPAEARRLLEHVVAEGLDPEGSVAPQPRFLQERAMPEALAARQKAGSFRDDHPLVPEPAVYIGPGLVPDVIPRSTKFKTAPGMPEPFFERLNLATSPFPHQSSSSQHNRRLLTSSSDRKMTGYDRKQRPAAKSFHAVVDYAFGSGDRGITLVGHDDHDQSRELRLSRYRDRSDDLWDVTSGHPIHPTSLAENLGQPLTSDAVKRCLLCHVTEPRGARTERAPRRRPRNRLRDVPRARRQPCAGDRGPISGARDRPSLVSLRSTRRQVCAPSAIAPAVAPSLKTTRPPSVSRERR